MPNRSFLCGIEQSCSDCHCIEQEPTVVIIATTLDFLRQINSMSSLNCPVHLFHQWDKFISLIYLFKNKIMVQKRTLLATRLEYNELMFSKSPSCLQGHKKKFYRKVHGRLQTGGLHVFLSFWLLYHHESLPEFYYSLFGHYLQTLGTLLFINSNASLILFLKLFFSFHAILWQHPLLYHPLQGKLFSD